MPRKRKSEEDYLKTCPLCQRMKNGIIPSRELHKVFHRHRGKYGQIVEEEFQEEEEE